MRGITVTLYERTQTGLDELNHPIYEETAENVDNVLVAPSSSSEAIESTNLDGRIGDYTMPEEGIEKLIPLSWNKKVRVERYEQG